MDSSKENRRRSARTGTPSRTWAIIHKKQFTINDIGNQGMGIFVDGPDVFFLGQRIDTIQFLGATGMPSIPGIVSHITKNDRGFICGIRFVFSDSKHYQCIEALAQKFRDVHQQAPLSRSSDKKDSPK